MTYRWTTPGKYTFAKNHHQVIFATDADSATAADIYGTANVDTSKFFGRLKFQDGPIQEHGRNGVTNEEVIEMLLERLDALNQPPYACRENSVAITNLEQALMWLQRRTAKRQAKGIEGTSTP